MYAIYACMDIKPEHVDAFIAASLADGEGSLRDEPGCVSFELLRDPSRANRFYFYEVYRDEAAFEAHSETPHFKAWEEAVAPMVALEHELVVMQRLFPPTP